MGLVGGTAEWVFAFPDRLSVTVSAADRLVDMDTQELAALLWRDVAAVHGLAGPAPPCRIVKEKRATFAATPAQDARRPACPTRWTNLFLAGDWTATGLPATIEGALRSGEKRRGSRPMNDAVDDLMAIEADIRRAAQALLRQQRSDGHWVFELEADATIPAEYVLLRQYLGEPDDLELERKIGVYLRRIQGEHGGWPLFHGGAFDISASVKAYFCLKMIGDSPDAPHMARARAAILAHGGAVRANVFTRILLAQFGELSWNARADHAGRADAAAALVPDPSLAHVLLGAHRDGADAGAGGAAGAGAQPARRAHPGALRRDRHGDRRRRLTHQQARLGAVLQRTGRRAEGGRAVLAEVPAPPRHRALRGAS